MPDAPLPERYGVITFAIEPWDDFKREACQLWDKHWEEVALHKDSIKLNVDYAAYDAQDAAGALAVVTARAKGVIVGYWLGIIRPHFHYADSLTAYTDIYFIDKPYRKTGAGAQLFAFVERMLAQRGVQKIFTATKVYQDHSALFKAAGYQETEIVFTKLLRE